MRAGNSGAWLRQDGLDGQSVLNAGYVSKRGTNLQTLTAFIYDVKGHFSERIEAASANLQDGYWVMKDAVVARVGKEPEKFDTYLLSTYLSPERVADAFGTVISVSVWELPDLIQVAEKAGISATKLRVQYETPAEPPADVRGDGLFGGYCVVKVIPLRWDPDYGHNWNDRGVRFLPFHGDLTAGWLCGTSARLGCCLGACDPGHSCFADGADAPGGRLSDACCADHTGDMH